MLEAGAGCSQATTESMLEVVHTNLRAEVPRWCVPYSERNTVSRRRASKSRRTRVDWRAIRGARTFRRKGKPELTPGLVSHCRSHAGDSQASQKATSAVWSR
jgi:hypothetical protein